MRVQVVSPWFPDYANVYSGAFVASQVRFSRYAGHDVSIEVPQIFPAPPGHVPQRVLTAMARASEELPDAMFNTEGSATYIPVPVPAGSSVLRRADAFRTSMAMKREVKPVDYDLVHAHLGLPTGWACLRIGDTPLVVTEHQSGLPEKLAEQACAEAYAETLETASAFICVSRTLKRTLVDRLGTGVEDRISIVPNIVDVDAIPFVEPAEHRFSNWIYTGRLLEDKGVKLLLRSFHIYVRHVDPKAKLTVVGGGPLEGWITEFARDHGLETRVRLEGEREQSDIGRLLVAHDVFVHLSRHETFGVAALEAIAAGLPVVSLRNGGAEDAWGDVAQICGVLLDRDATADDIATAIAELRRDPTRLDPMTARTIVQQRFSGERVAGLLTEIYDQVTS